jgi:translation initiation factor 3 subunit K
MTFSVGHDWPHHRSYQFNPHLARDETITNILVKALTVFPSPDFSLCLSLLPVHTLAPLSSSAHNPAAGDAPLSEAVQKLNELRNLLEGADYASFWSTLDSDDLYADLIADVSGFEELMRVRIATTVSQAVREVDQSILESWLNLSGEEFQHFVGSVCGWTVESGKVKVPINKDNEAKGTVVRENVKFDRKLHAGCCLTTNTKLPTEFARVIKRAYEQPAWAMNARYDDTRWRTSAPQERALGVAWARRGGRRWGMWLQQPAQRTQ